MTAVTQPVAETTTSVWEIDPSHSEIGFSVKHLMIANVRGRFATVRGSIELDEADMSASAVNVEIDAASIDTREEKRDAHLRSADFFDVGKHPLITFRSTKVQGGAGKKLQVIGELSIRGVARTVVLETTEEGRGGDPWGGERIAFSATTRVNRDEFGLKWNQALETGGVLVGNEIRISLEIEASRKG